MDINNTKDAKEAYPRKDSTELHIEDKINNMLTEVMEEKDSCGDSFEFDCKEIDDEFKLSRPSTRHQTQNMIDLTSINNSNSNNSSQFITYPSGFNRANKRNLTHNMNLVPPQTFLVPLPNHQQIPRKSYCYSNYVYNNNFNPNLYNNSFNSNTNNNVFPFVYNYNNLNLSNMSGLSNINNLNNSYQSLLSFNQSFNPQLNDNSFISNNNIVGNNNIINNNIINNNNFPYPLNNNINNMNNRNNLIFNNNINNINNINNFKRKENRKKTHDVQSNFHKKKHESNYFNLNNFQFGKNKDSRFFSRKSFSNSNNNMLFKNMLNNNNINDNNNIIDKNNLNYNEHLDNDNNIIENKNIFNSINSINNINNNCVNDNLIFELKNLLEHTGKIDFYIYNIMKGKILLIIKNHKGSKIFQKYLKSTHSDEILHLIFIELQSNLEELIIDPYANYFCKKFFTYLNQKDRIEFLKSIEKSIIKLSLDNIGTYPIQSIIEHLNTKNEKNIIISGLKENFEKLIYDTFGCHVLEKLLTCFEDDYVNFIYNYILDNFLNLTNNSNGIYIIKKILTFTQKKNLHEKLKNIVKKNTIFLIKQSYGNFVIQVIIETWNDYKEITDLLKNNFLALSLEKYASNVIERCIEKDEEILENYINEIIESKCIADVMKSNYGNYVIQKAIKLSKGNSKNKFVFNAAKEIDKLNDNKLIQKWKSLLSPHINDLSEEMIQALKNNNYFGNN